MSGRHDLRVPDRGQSGCDALRRRQQHLVDVDPIGGGRLHGERDLPLRGVDVQRRSDHPVARPQLLERQHRTDRRHRVRPGEEGGKTQPLRVRGRLPGDRSLIGRPCRTQRHRRRGVPLRPVQASRSSAAGNGSKQPSVCVIVVSSTASMPRCISTTATSATTGGSTRTRCTHSWYQSLGHAFQVVPNVRYYSQSEADFYRPFDDFRLPPDTPQSSDFRLSAYGAFTFGLKGVFRQPGWISDHRGGSLCREREVRPLVRGSASGPPLLHPRVRPI